MHCSLRTWFTVVFVLMAALAHAAVGSAVSSPEPFDTTDPVVLVESPSGGQYYSGAGITAGWTANDSHQGPSPITIYWRETVASAWSVIASGEDNDGVCTFTAPDAYSDEAQILVVMTDSWGNTGQSESAVFTILPGETFATSVASPFDTVDPVLGITSPTSNSVYIFGDDILIEWLTTESSVTDTCLTIAWRPDSLTVWDSIAVTIPDVNSHTWQAPNQTTETAELHLSLVDAFGNTGDDLSELFTILRPGADFTSDIVTGHVPLTVNFADATVGTPTSWEWDFDNDGRIDSTEPNPMWTYLFPWDYTVSLTVELDTGERLTTRQTFETARRTTRDTTSIAVKLDYIHATLDSTITHFVPTDFATIQAAIDASVDGDYVIVEHGEYAGDIEIVDKEITLASLYFIDGDESHINSTFISGQANGNRIETSLLRIVRDDPGNPSLHPHIVGLYFVYGAGTVFTRDINGQAVTKEVGGGIFINGHNPWLTKNKVETNTAEDEGGGTYAFLGAPNQGGGIGEHSYNPGGNVYLNNFADLGNDIYIVAPSTRDEIKMENCHFNVYSDDNASVSDYWANSNAILNTSGGSGDVSAITTDIYVERNGSDYVNTGLTPDSPFKSITHALSMAYGTSENPVTIHVGLGTFSEQNTYERFPLQMVSWVNICGLGEHTKIDATGAADRVITCNNVSNCVISNLTIKKGAVTEEDKKFGGGVACDNASQVRFENVTIRDNTAWSMGGGLYAYQSSVIGDSLCIIHNNLTLNSNNDDSEGGGIYAIDSSIQLQHCCIDSNTANVGGGAYWEGMIEVDVSETACKYNTASSGNGGAITIWNADNVRVARSLVQGNVAPDGSGGGITCQADSLSFTNNMFLNNYGSDYGGGLHFLNCNGVIAGNLIANNTAQFGGGVYSNEDMLFSANTITNNSGYQGGGLYIHSSSPVIENGILWGNDAPHGSQACIASFSSAPTFRYSDVQYGSSGFVFLISAPSESITYEYNQNVDPLFVAPTAGAGVTYDALAADWSLQEGSPCINAGDSLACIALFPLDIAGNPRISNLVIDQGAYEYFVLTALDSPSNITLVTTATQIVISWDEVNNAASYRVFTDTDIDGDFTSEATSQGQITQADGRVTWTTLRPTDDRRYYMVRATDVAPPAALERTPQLTERGRKQ